MCHGSIITNDIEVILTETAAMEQRPTGMTTRLWKFTTASDRYIASENLQGHETDKLCRPGKPRTHQSSRQLTMPYTHFERLSPSASPRTYGFTCVGSSPACVETDSPQGRLHLKNTAGIGV
jgi:hypothetical protein